MTKEKFIGKLQMCYFGDRNAFNEIVGEYDRLKAKYERIYNENCKLREQHNINDVSLLDENNRLNNIINELDDEIYSLYEDICNSDDTYSYRIPIEIIIDRLFKMTSKIAKFKENEELKDSDKE